MKALIIREPWIGKILSGSKTWEMRSSRTNVRGTIGLIRKGGGLVVALADLVDSLPPLDGTNYATARGRHGIPSDQVSEVLRRGWVYPWVLSNTRSLAEPIVAQQRSGAVAWVMLPGTAVVAISAQLGRLPLHKPRGAAP